MPAATSDPPYAPLLKRRPVQARSIARVDAILDAAAALAADDLEALTMRAVGARAGVPPATIYQFFDDREALIQALAVRYVAATPAVLESALDASLDSWPQALERVVDGFAGLLRREPAMRTLWLAGAMDAATARFAAAADDGIAERLRARLVEISGREDRGTDTDWRFLVTLVGDLLKRSFRHDPDGDGFLLDRSKRVAVLYSGDLLA
ncbi:MAG: TetR/AcrR family transcriptional regulator [Solirubrobacterales bacterium]